VRVRKHSISFCTVLAAIILSCPAVAGQPKKGPLEVFTLASESRAAPSVERPMETEAERIVSQYRAIFDVPPNGVPSRDSAREPLLGNGDLGVVISGKPEAQRYWISKNNFLKLKDGHRAGGPRPFGGLEINIPAMSNATYRVEQELFSAITVSRFTKGGNGVTMRSFVAATEPVLVVELSAEGAPVQVETRMWVAPGRGSQEELGRKDCLLWATKEFTRDVIKPTAAACVLTVIGGKFSHPDLEPFVPQVIPNPPPKRMPPPKVKSQPGPTFTLQPGQNVTVAVVMQSSFDTQEPLAVAQKRALEVNAEKVKTLGEKHRQWWRSFWASSLVEIGNPILEQRYYLSNYVMGSGSRDPEFPQGLFGLWTTDDDPRWAGDYHLNYNYQAQFYGLYSCNHIEQAVTFEAPVLAFMERGRAAAKELLKTRGVYYVVGIGAKGVRSCKPNTFLGQKSNAAYCLANIHPLSKEEVGRRLSLVALTKTYGRPIEYSGPLYERMEIKGNTIRLRFTQIGSGLVAKGGEPLKRFAIPGADRKFVWGEARIDGKTVVVSSPTVPNPVAVRYAWDINPEGCNLFNAAGLPASPFRTDDWKLETARQ